MPQHARALRRKRMIVRLRADAAAQLPARTDPPSRTPTALLVTPLADRPPMDPPAPPPALAPSPSQTLPAIPYVLSRDDTAFLSQVARAEWAARPPLGSWTSHYPTARPVDDTPAPAAALDSTLASTFIPATGDAAAPDDPAIMALVCAQIRAGITSRTAARNSGPPLECAASPPNSGSTPPPLPRLQPPSAPYQPTSPTCAPPAEHGAPCTPPHTAAAVPKTPSSIERLLPGVSDQALAGVGEPDVPDGRTTPLPSTSDDIDMDISDVHTPDSPGLRDFVTLPAASGNPAPRRRASTYLRHQRDILRDIANRAPPGMDANRILAIADGSREVPPELWDRVEKVFRQTKICGIIIGDLVNFARANGNATAGRERTIPRPQRRVLQAARRHKTAPPAAPARLSPMPVPDGMDATATPPVDSPGSYASISPLPPSETYSIRSNSRSDSDAPRTSSRTQSQSPPPDDSHHSGRAGPPLLTKRLLLDPVSPLLRPGARTPDADPPPTSRARSLTWSTTDSCLRPQPCGPIFPVLRPVIPPSHTRLAQRRWPPSPPWRQAHAVAPHLGMPS
jgi:hypothetical protein